MNKGGIYIIEDIQNLKQEKEVGNVVNQNPGATLIDLGDGICCVEFRRPLRPPGSACRS